MMKLKQLTLCVFAVVATGSTYAQNVIVSVGNNTDSDPYQDAVFSLSDNTNNDALATGEYYVVNFGTSSDKNSCIYFARNNGSTDGVHLAEIDATNGKITIGMTSESTRGPKVSVSNNSKGYATYCSPFLLQIPSEDNILVYAPTYDTESCVLKLNSGTQVNSANYLAIKTPVLIKAKTVPTGNESFYFSGHNNYSCTIYTPTKNALSGTIHAKAASSITSGTVYTLGRKTGETSIVGFFRFTGENISACKSYLVLSDSNAAINASKSVMLNTEEETPETATDIDGITEVISKEKSIAHNLSGQRVNSNTKGIIIVNGKKYINK